VFYNNYLLIKNKLNNNGANMPKPIQFKTLLVLMLLFSSSTNVFSQTIKTYVDNQWQKSRYIDHKNGTITDTKTALMWKRCAEGLGGNSCVGTATEYNYKRAIELTNNYTFANHNDWRLPNIKELASLAARDRYDPAINSEVFPMMPTVTADGYYIYFLSSSPYLDNTGSITAWVLSFFDGKSGNTNRGNNRHVLLVRDVE
jgi:hypothetical protein